ncbi:MAG: hypothetical protein A2Z38_00885 [Planctomycetes bacterium RBG_19FT_COMBO_48_8]|nr:MAG: hypothetical protein A2Z38_00885 [Planctomycetes bacterium RBG_19FT_COMBO_48_8]
MMVFSLSYVRTLQEMGLQLLTAEETSLNNQKELLHYSSGGKKLDTCDDVSDDQKWIAVAR